MYLWFCVSVHFRVRVMDQHRPKTLSPSTSGITYWQIEAEHSIIDGNVKQHTVALDYWIWPIIFFIKLLFLPNSIRLLIFFCFFIFLSHIQLLYSPSHFRSDVQIHLQPNCLFLSKAELFCKPVSFKIYPCYIWALRVWI